MNNIFLDAKTVRDINKFVDRVHREIGYVDGAIALLVVRDLLNLDLKYYRLDDPGLVDEVLHKLRVGAKQVFARPRLLVEAVRKFDLSALFMPDRKRIFVDEGVPDLKKRWYESHEIAHSLIPWHSDYTLGDNRSTLSQGCHERIEAEANYGGGRLLFPNEVFTQQRLVSTLSMARIREIAKHFGNTITSTLWRCVEQSDELTFAAIGEHPRRPRDGKPTVEYFVRSRTFTTQFPGVTDGDVWAWLCAYCGSRATGPLGATEITIRDANGTPQIFFIESFSNGYNVLTLARWIRQAPTLFPVGGGATGLRLAPSSSLSGRRQFVVDMWYETLPQGRTWTSLIGDHVLCECGGIRTINLVCPACGSEPYDTSPQVIEHPPWTRLVVSQAFLGAEGRGEDYQLLALMEREWRRPPLEPATRSWLTGGMSDRATLVLLYWTYFESRMNRLVDVGLQKLPPGVKADLSARYDSVSSHMRSLYQILFGVRYRDDLIAVGAEEVDGHLARVQDARNRFVHGEPGAISDELVEAVVKKMKVEHDAWIAVFNRRISIQRANISA